MRVEILNQRMGDDPALEHILELTGEGSCRFRSVRLLVAYTSRRGLQAVMRALQEYLDQGGQVEIILGIDGEATTLEALQYLMEELPGAEKYVFCANNPRICFHPKVYLFEGDSEMVGVLGSSNLTAGGLVRNFEADVRLDLDKASREDQDLICQLEELWQTYRAPSPPVQTGNLQRLDEYLELLESDEHLEEVTRATERQRFRRERTRGGLPAIGFPRIDQAVDLGGFGLAPERVWLPGERLYLQVLKETGAGGTQVQLPTRALREFFRVHDFDEPNSIYIGFEAGESREARILHFENNTHRISLPEVASLERPCILFFEKTAEEQHYRCYLIEGNTRAYEEALEECTEQTRTSAKRWGVAN